VVEAGKYKAVLVRNIEEVPVGANGYFSPSGLSAYRLKSGWFHEGRPMREPASDSVFTSHDGKPNEGKLVELLVEALVEPAASPQVEDALAALEALVNEVSWKNDRPMSDEELKLHATTIGDALRSGVLS
jgi:hypothetical protein